MRLSRASLLPIVLLAALTPATTARAAGGTAPPSAGFVPGVPLTDTSGASLNGSEPSILVDSHDNVFASAPVGVPTGGCPFWYVHPDAPNGAGKLFDYRGTIDVDHGGAGGGDCDISSTKAVGTADDVSVTSLSLANLTSNVTTDAGATFKTAANNASQQVFGVDRQWQASDDQLGRHYLTVHDLATDNIQVSVSTDGGYQFVQNTPAINPATNAAALSYGPVTLTALSHSNHFGALVVNPANHHVYIPFLAPLGNTGSGAQNTFYLAEGDPCAVACQAGVPAGPITWTTHTVFADPAADNLANDFPTIALDRNGTVYAGFTGAVTKAANAGSGYDANRIFVTHSKDASLDAWTTPQAVDGGTGNSNVFPWLAAGTKGNVAIAFYSSTLAPNGACPGGVGTAGNGTSVSDNCLNLWHVAVAQSADGDSDTPSWTVNDASGLVHAGPVCNRGLSCATGTRTLLDFFDTDLDSQGRLNLVYASDTRAPGTADVKYTRQCTGSSLTGTDLGGTCYPLGTPPPCPTNGAYTDPAGDANAVLGTSTPAPSDPAFDVVSGSLSTVGSSLRLSVKLNDLTDGPVGQIVEQHFKVNGHEYYVMAQRATGTHTITYVYGEEVTDPQTGVPGRSEIGSTTGTFDDTTDLVTTDFPFGSRMANGDVVSDVVITTRRDGVAAIPDVDTAKGACAYTLGAADPAVDVPDVPFAALAPVAGLLVLGTVYYRRRRTA